uniref:Extracellular matrix protein 2 n=1 Tax=Poecilia formosa TaxID=48698 RepID=A0A096M9E5_POEFO
MRQWLVWAALWLLVVLILPDAQAESRHRNQDGVRRRGKRWRDGQGFIWTSEGRSKPLKIRLVPGPKGPHTPAGTLTFYRNIPELQSSYSVIPAGKQTQCVYRGLTMLDLAVWSPSPCVTCLCSEGRVVCDEMTCPTMHCPFPATPAGRCCPVCMEPDRSTAALCSVASAADSGLSPELSGDSPVPSHPKDHIVPLTQEDIQRIVWREEEEHREEERQEEEALRLQMEVWLRGDVFQMPSKEELLPPPVPTHPTETVVLPAGCDISDVSMTCENVQLIHFPPLNIPELKSLSLEGNNISSIPAGAFNGIPNLEWINLKKNKLTSAGIDPKAFMGLKMLRRLYLDENLLDVVPSDLPSTLQELKINENKLRGIDENSFQDLSSLVILELEGNLLSEGNVNPRAFAPLIQLSYLRLGRNHFRTVPQGLPKSLLELYLENNLIEEISETVFNQTTNLNMVSLRHNKLDETRIAPMAWFNHRNLESIDLSHNDFYLVPSYLPKSLVHLVLVGNKVERIPGYIFAHMDPGLEYLYLSFNRLDGEGIEPESFFGTYHSMMELCLDHNQLIHVPLGINEMTNLHLLRLDSNRIRSISEESICDPDLQEETTLVALRMENNYIDAMDVSPAAFSCLRYGSSVVLKPQKTIQRIHRTRH